MYLDFYIMNRKVEFRKLISIPDERLFASGPPDRDVAHARCLQVFAIAALTAYSLTPSSTQLAYGASANSVGGGHGIPRSAPLCF